MGSSTQADIRKLPTTKLQTILGINAAWTASEGSGVTLFRKQETGGWSCCAVAPSYSSFLDLADGHPVQWDAPGCFSDAGVDLNTLLPAAEKIAGARPTVVTVGMPLATSPIERRRKADDDISSAFGAMGCGAHTPNPARPGPLAERMRSASEGTGYGLAHVGPHLGPRTGSLRSIRIRLFSPFSTRNTASPIRPHTQGDSGRMRTCPRERPISCVPSPGSSRVCRNKWRTSVCRYRAPRVYGWARPGRLKCFLM